MLKTMLSSGWRKTMNWADSARRVTFNGLFLLALGVLGIAIVSGLISKLTSTPIEEKTALVVSIQGNVVEQSTYDPQKAIQNSMMGQSQSETVLRDIVRAFYEAADDERVERVFLDLDDMGEVGLSSLREIALAMEYFRESGKEILYRGVLIDQRRYYLAAHADEIYLDPLGGVFFMGFGRDRLYYKEAFERLGLNVHLVHTGDYKNFAEPFVRQSPSTTTRETDKRIYDGLWEMFLEDIESARGLEQGHIKWAINNLIEDLESNQYEYAQLSVEQGFADGIKTQQEFREMMIERGAEDEEKHTFRQISLHGYLDLLDPAVEKGIAIIVAEGGIVDGHAPAGAIGGDTTSQKIRKVRQNDDVKAIVFRVNSGGGSAFASEQIRRELALAQEQGLAVIVSMGNVAASGGYWVSLAADHVVADKNTVTGSIGVVSMFATIEEVMEKLSLNLEGHATTWIREVLPDPRKDLDPRFKKLMAGGTHKIYRDFLSLTASARDKELEELKELAEGRIWTGVEAHERGLIDSIGGLSEAISVAIDRAGLDAETANVFYAEREKSRFEKILARLDFATISTFIPSIGEIKVPLALELLGRDFLWLESAIFGLTDQSESMMPRPMAHCFCEHLSL